MFRNIWKILPVFMVEFLARKRIVKTTILYRDDNYSRYEIGCRVFNKVIFLENKNEHRKSID